MAKHQCDLCTNASNPDNFGGLCDTCEAKRQARTDRTARLLAQRGHANTEFGRAVGAHKVAV